MKNAVTSPAPPSLNITTVINDQNGQQIGTSSLGTAAPGGKAVQQAIKVKSGASYSVHGDLSSGVNVFKSGNKTVNQDLPNEEVDITQLQVASLDPTDISAIQATFSQLGANVGFNPVTVPSALNSIFGGLVWYVDTGNDPVTSETQLVAVISPSQLTGTVSLSDFQYPAGPVITKDATINTDSSVKASATVPLWGSLAASFATNSVYKTHWSMTGFGNVTKNDGNVSFQDKINALGPAQKDDICTRLNTPKSQLMYVNEMYVVKSVVLDYQEGMTVNSSATLSGGSVIAGGIAYDFSSSGTQEAEVDDTVVNIQGPLFSSSTLSFCTPAAAAPAPPPPPAVNEVGALKHLSANITTGENFAATPGNSAQLAKSVVKLSK